MSDFALPLAFALLVWWTATAIVMFLDGLPRSTFRWTLLGVTVLQAAALYGLWRTRSDTSVAGARRLCRRGGVNQGRVCVPPETGSLVQPNAVQSIWPEKWQSSQPLSLPYASSVGATS